MFKMQLLINSPLEKGDFPCHPIYDENLVDYRAVLADICNVFQESNHIKFYVSGFGEDEWPVDCKFDLLTIVEQLPELVIKINSNSYNFILDFYEQGTERELVFKEKSDNIQILCNSRTNWIPKPEKLTMNKSEVKNIILKLYQDFINISACICKNLLFHPLMKDFIVEYNNEQVHKKEK